MFEDLIINITCSKLHYTLKEYYGGFCDIYKPFGNNIRSYDVISQYPSVMSKYDMPVKEITRVVGDPYKFRENPFGFFYVNVTAPNIQIPILPYRLKHLVVCIG